MPNHLLLCPNSAMARQNRFSAQYRIVLMEKSNFLSMPTRLAAISVLVGCKMLLLIFYVL
jgi:hypothetical protein